MEDSDLCYWSAVEIATAIKQRRLSPYEVTRTILNRIERLNPKLNAYCTVAREAALTASTPVKAPGERLKLGPLFGVPISIKDLIFTKGMRTTSGSRLFANRLPEEDAPVVERVKRAGAIILGKTNTPEFGWKGATDNPLFGATRNPWDLSRTAGGSSGGAAAAVAAGMGPLAIGSDGAGSIRIPASFCGIFGLKPSLGRVPYYPPSPAGLLSHVGPMTRTVADAALLLDVIAGPDDRDRFTLPAAGLSYLKAVQAAAREGESRALRGVRLAWSANLGYAPVDPEVAAITATAAERFAELGCAVEARDPGFADPLEAITVLFFSGEGAFLNAQPESWRELVDPGLVAAVDETSHFTARDFARATFAGNAVWEAMRRLMAEFDALLTPAVAVPAFPLGAEGPAEVAGQPVKRLGWTPFSFPFNMTGQPAATIPVGFTRGGLPVGLQIVGQRHDDAGVLRLAAAYEAAFPWREKKPIL